MRHPKLTLGILLALSIPLATAQAASRTIQFAGLTGVEMESPKLNAENGQARCVITLVNASANDQVINSVEFIEYSANGRTTEIVSAQGDSNSRIILRGTTSSELSDITCIGSSNPLKAGAVCMIKHYIDSFSVGGRYGLCAGRIKVSDKTATSPGSVVAAGAIFMVQEAKVVTGTLSGALYLSGSPPHGGAGPSILSTVAGKDAPVSGTLQDDPDSGNNMNLYCSKTCKDIANFSDEECDAACGSVPSGYATPKSEWNFYHSILGYMIPGTVSGAPFAPPSAQPGNYYLRIANPYWAGGMVYEINMGAWTSICNGNADYFSKGGVDHAHDSSAGIYQYSADRAAGAKYLERLHCAHRHFQPDLTSKVGSVTAFPVNGGLPF